MEQRQITAPTWAFAKVLERQAKLAKIADRIGCPAPQVTVVDRVMQPLTHWYLTEREMDLIAHGLLANPPVEHVVFTVSGETPVLPGGWRLLATVEHLGEGIGNWVAASPMGQGMGLGESLHDAPATCDHCQTNRRRRYTFVVLSTETGEMVRIGKGCLASHLGMHGFPEDALIGWARELSDGDEGWGGGAPEHPSFAIIATLAFASVRTNGWHSTGEDYPTRADVSAWLSAKSESLRPFTVTDADKAQAEQALAWLAEVDVTGNDFLRNLQMIGRIGQVDHKRMGTAVAVVRAWQRHVEGLVREAARAEERAAAAPVPVGKAVVITGTVVKVDVQYNDYGSRHVWVVASDAGWKVWGTIPSGCYALVGDRVTFTADVERSDRDETFGFTKRPRKAQVHAKA